MASEQTSPPESSTRRESPRDSRVPAKPSPNNGPPLLNDGLELVRDSHC
jgi:hypothetical protein